MHPPSTTSVQARDDPGRHETEEEREDRNLMELLQELRVAGIGVQVLFGFLLSLPFTARFARIDGTQRHLYIASLLMAALATGLLSAPVAYHRLVFRQHKKAPLLRVANAMALVTDQTTKAPPRTIDADLPCLLRCCWWPEWFSRESRCR